jgi:hypothetical protein
MAIFNHRFKGIYKEIDPLSRENNILPPYVRTIFIPLWYGEHITLFKMTPFK